MKKIEFQIEFLSSHSSFENISIYFLSSRKYNCVIPRTSSYSKILFKSIGCIECKLVTQHVTPRSLLLQKYGETESNDFYIFETDKVIKTQE